MEQLLFYPVMTPELSEKSGISVEKYKFTYTYEHKNYELEQRGMENLSLTDPLGIWDIETEGLSIDKTIRITYPERLKGRDGIVASGAELGVCIIWTNKKLTQTGIILPEEESATENDRKYKFRYSFDPGRISGDLELSVSVFVCEKSENLLPGEEHLINEKGVFVGELEHVKLNFENNYMDFPIEECCSDKEPLWWIEFSEWEDPKSIDRFTKDSFCLYLNTYYEGCPKPSLSGSGKSMRNFDLLIDILSQTYLMIFQRLSDDDLDDTRKNINLAPDSICSVLNWFIENCEGCMGLDWTSPERLLKSLQVNLRELYREENNG